MRNLDLNLLVPLEALLSERSVTRAAERLGGSQPALSTALGRLRRHFDDELLTRIGNHYELTALAEQLLPQLRTVLAGAERVFASGSEFDPATSDRRFTVMSSDYGTALVGPVLHRVVATAAPGTSLALEPLSLAALDGFGEALLDVDVILLPRGIARGGAHLDLLVDEWVAVVDPANARVGDELDLTLLGALPWVATAAAPAGATAAVESIPPVRQLELLGIRPRVAATTESFLAALLLVPGTDRVAVVPRRLAVAQGPGSGRALRVLSLPFAVVPLVEAAWWHPAHERDGGHRWLRRQLRQVAAELAVPVGTIAAADAGHPGQQLPHPAGG